MISNYFIGSSLTAISSIIGASIWAASNDIFTLVGIYDFHWFVSVTSFIFSIIAYSIHTFSFIFDAVQQPNLIHIHIVSILLIGGIYTLFWFISAVNLSIVLRECLDIKKTYQNFLNDDLHLITESYNYSCNGEIVSVIFSYVNYIVWSFILIKSSKIWYDRYVFDNITAIQIQNIEQQIPELQQVQVETANPVIGQFVEIQEQPQEQVQEQVQEQPQVQLQEQPQVQLQEQVQEQEQHQVQPQVQLQEQVQEQVRKSKVRKYTRQYKNKKDKN